MKVLFILHYPGFGGANQSAFHLMRILRNDHGVRPHVLIPFAGVVEERLREENIPCRRIRYASWRGPRRGLKGALFAIVTTIVNLIALPKGLWLIRKERIDVIHINSSLAFYGWLLGKIAHVPVVWHLREFGDTDYPMSFYYGEGLSGRVIGSSDAVIAISRNLCDYYARFVKPKDRMRVVYNGIDVQKAIEGMNDCCKDLKLESGFRLCTIGSISDSKNQIEVVQALGVLNQKQLLGDIEYYVIGGAKGSSADRFWQAVNENGLGDKVHVLGAQENIWPWAARMDAFVVPSLREGFGRVVIEGMVCGHATIGADTGALPELIEDGQDGFLYQCGNPHSLAEKIRILRDDEPLCKRMGEKALRKARTSFTAELNAHKVLECYKELP